jgi:CrcB protein
MPPFIGTVCYELWVQLFPTSSQLAGRGLPEAFALVAIGGALGATGRWAVGTLFDTEPGVWPWPTFIVNVIGCMLIGFTVGRVERGSLRWDFAVTGVLGGFTTMSSFAVELNEFVDANRSSMAVTYGALTLASGAAALLATSHRASS